MTLPGTYSNPSHRQCWGTCQSCFRCEDKGRYTHCKDCSGRHDPRGHIDPDIDDYCDCRNGILRWKTQKGQRVIVPIKSNPFGGKVMAESRTEDERDWESYLGEMRERFDNPNWDPIELYKHDQRLKYMDGKNGFKLIEEDVSKVL